MQQVMRYKKVSGGDGYADMMAVRPDGRWVKAQDYDALAAAVIEQQAEIERLREALDRIRDGYGPNHLSKYARDVAAAAIFSGGKK